MDPLNNNQVPQTPVYPAPSPMNVPPAPQMPPMYQQAPMAPKKSKKGLFIALGVVAVLIIAGIAGILIFLSTTAPKLNQKDYDYVKSVGKAYNDIITNGKAKLGDMSLGDKPNQDDADKMSQNISDYIKSNNSTFYGLSYGSGVNEQLYKKLSQVVDVYSTDLKETDGMLRYAVALTDYLAYATDLSNVDASSVDSLSKVSTLQDQLYKKYSKVSSKMSSIYFSDKTLENMRKDTYNMMTDIEDELDYMYSDVRDVLYVSEKSPNVSPYVKKFQDNIGKIASDWSKKSTPILDTVQAKFKDEVKAAVDAFVNEYNRIVKDYNLNDAPKLVENTVLKK